MAQKNGLATENLSNPRLSLHSPSPSPFPVSLTVQRFLSTSTTRINSAITLSTMRNNVRRSHRSSIRLPHRSMFALNFNYASYLSTSQPCELMLCILTGHLPVSLIVPRFSSTSSISTMCIISAFNLSIMRTNIMRSHPLSLLC